MTTLQHLSEKLTERRKQSGLSMTDVAQRSGVARAALYRFNNGGDVNLSTFLATADALGLDVVLAPKSVSKSLQTSIGDSMTKFSVLPVKPYTGPLSAVDATLAKLRARLNKGKP